MLKDERQVEILETLRREGKVVATDVSRQLGVSEDTIRRDLRDLADAGRLRRVHGGALPRSPVATTYRERQKQTPGGKAAVAAEAVKLVESGQVIIIDGGATALQVVQRLPMDLEATVVTHSPPIAAALAEHPQVEVIVVGGTLYKDGIVTLGAEVVKAFSAINADLCFQGIWSLHPETGISHPNYEEAFVKRAMIESADRLVALASAEKLGTISSFVVAPAEAVTHLVTERSVPAEVLDPFRKLGVEVSKG